MRTRPGHPTRSRLLGPAAMVGCAAAWALGTVLSKGVLDRTAMRPLDVLTVQLVASVVALGTVATLAAVRSRAPVRVGALLRDGWTGLLEPGLAFVLTMVGLALTSAASATVLTSLEPVLIPLVAWAVLRSRPTARQLVVVATAAVGAVVVAWSGGSGGGSAGGDVLVVLGVGAAALYAVASSRHAAHHPPVALAAAQQVWALALTAAVAGVVAISTGTTWPTQGHLVAVAATGLCTLSIPFSLYLLALRHMDVAEAAPYLCLIPVFGVTSSAVLLGEAVGAVQVLGVAVVIAALLVGGVGSRPRAGTRNRTVAA
ncbi:DMT family transporter [Dermatobacter hominis]|uniref:DMT family transporter n=1 Tax=Dermatobacter hominis TaxID=2884263 RepID=UPI001D11F5F4|nr:DMT family transporter [Dermatobacter hominis]UDY35635.1 DMT family transporter [Dermatobacter hominis]